MRNYFSAVQLRSRHPSLAAKIDSLISHGSVKATRTVNGVAEFDEELITVAAHVHAVEADIILRGGIEGKGTGICRHTGIYQQDVDAAEKRLGLT